MILFNKKQVNKLLLNKKNISKILLNKKIVFSNALHPDAIKGKLNFELPEINGLNDYFIFLFLTHKTIDKPHRLLPEILKELAESKVSRVYESSPLNPLYYSNFRLNGIPVAQHTELLLGKKGKDLVNGYNNLNLLSTIDRVVTSKYERGLISFFEGSHTHIIPSECIETEFRNCCVFDGEQLASAFLMGQVNSDLSANPLVLPDRKGRPFEDPGYLAEVEAFNNRVKEILAQNPDYQFLQIPDTPDPLKTLDYIAENTDLLQNADFLNVKRVDCNINFEMDNNALKTAAYDVFTYCIKSTGEYKLLTRNSNFDRETNVLSFCEDLTIYDSEWFENL